MHNFRDISHERPRILGGVQFSAVDSPIMEAKGHTVRTMASHTVHMNIGRVIGHSQLI